SWPGTAERALRFCALFIVICAVAIIVESSRVLVPLPDDPDVVVRQAQLVDTDTESDPEKASEAEESQQLGSRVPFMGEEFKAFEPLSTRTHSSHSSASSDFATLLSPDHPLTYVSPTPTPTLGSFHHTIIHMTVVPFEEQSDDLKKTLAKNNEAKMVLYNALPKKEYERIFMCKTAKDIWQSLLIIHQDNSQVKDNKTDLLVQQYEQFTILKEESIYSGFARFNTIITSFKALNEGFSSKNYVRKFLRVLHPKWRAKVMTIKESKDLSQLALDELIGNLKVHEVVMEKDSEIYRGKKEKVKSIALKAKKESSNDKTLTSRSDDEEYAMAVRNFKKFFRRKGEFVRKPREEKKSFQQRDEKKVKSN
nr:DUF4219 domain-containing protein/UBN2 domain-containing protein [Tanacetum cinerariifolium]